MPHPKFDMTNDNSLEINKRLQEEIESRQQAEAALRQSQEQYRSVVESQPALICRYAVDTLALTFVNHSYCRYFDRTAEELLGANFLLLVPEEAHESIRTQIEFVVSSGQPLTYQHTVLAPDGSVTWHEWTDLAILNEDGAVVEIQAIGRDITAQKEVEEELRNKTQQLETIADALPVRIGHQGPDLRYRFVNERYAEVTGIPRREIIGKLPDDIFPNISAYSETNKKALAGEVVIFERQFLSTDTQKPQYEQVVFVPHLVDDVVDGFFVMATDITEQKARDAEILQLNERLNQANQQLEERIEERTAELSNANQQLEQINQELQLFGYRIAHDFKQPLNSISMFAQILQTDKQEILDEESTTMLTAIQRSSVHLDNLIDGLSAYLKIDHAKAEYHQVSLSDVCSQVQLTLAANIRELDAEVTIETLPEIWGDVVMLRQLFQNLLANGLKFQPSGQKPRIRIAARPVEKEGTTHSKRYGLLGPLWQISITDNGIGINPEQEADLFKPFVRLQQGRSYSGMGLGLAICQKIIQEHHGQIWLDSEAGSGATICFTLPTPPESQVK